MQSEWGRRRTNGRESQGKRDGDGGTSSYSLGRQIERGELGHGRWGPGSMRCMRSREHGERGRAVGVEVGDGR